MKKQINTCKRREFMKIIGSAGAGFGLGLGTPVAASQHPVSEVINDRFRLPTYPLAQDYSIVYAVDDPKKFATSCSTLIRLPSGRLLTSLGTYLWKLNRAQRLASTEGISLSMISDDDGKTWGKLGEGTGPLFLVKDKLYQLIIRRRKDLRITVSDDEGKTWSEESIVLKGDFYNSVPQVVIRDNTLYWCMGMPNNEGEWNREGSRTIAIAADLNYDLLDPAAWRMSDPLTYPGTPELLNRNLYEGHDHYLEGNVVEIKGKLKVYWRIRIDNQGTAGVTAICDLEDDGKTLDYKFGQFHPLPGAQNEFSILHDKKSGLYWLFSNLVTHTQDLEWNKRVEENNWFKTPLGGHERRILTLHLSFDALNWLPAAYLVILPHMNQAANYVRAVIDGNDMLFASRTCINGPNSHDADMITFHRLPNFRELAKPLIPVMK